MNKVALATFSYFDVGSRNGSDPEQIGFNIDEIVFHMQFPLEGTGGNLLSGYWIKQSGWRCDCIPGNRLDNGSVVCADLWSAYEIADWSW